MQLTIVMYHYIRDVKQSHFPEIKALEIDQFKGQLSYLSEHYTIVTAQEVIAAIKGDFELPERAAWLTFDDGYIDHFLVVFDLLTDRGWQGSFFPAVNSIKHRELLDVNKIHFLLGSPDQDVEAILAEVKNFIDHRQDDFRVKEYQYYWTTYGRRSTKSYYTILDTREVEFIKRLLQKGLPVDCREQLLDQLFKKYVSNDMHSFADELYMSVDQLKIMAEAGMYIGSHGSKHCWMDQIDKDEQRIDIDQSLRFLQLVGSSTIRDWVMCYPYGANNEQLKKILVERGCVAALGTKPGVATVGGSDSLDLPRVDTIYIGRITR